MSPSCPVFYLHARVEPDSVCEAVLVSGTCSIYANRHRYLLPNRAEACRLVSAEIRPVNPIRENYKMSFHTRKQLLFLKCAKYFVEMMVHCRPVFDKKSKWRQAAKFSCAAIPTKYRYAIVQDPGGRFTIPAESAIPTVIGFANNKQSVRQGSQIKKGAHSSHSTLTCAPPRTNSSLKPHHRRSNALAPMILSVPFMLSEDCTALFQPPRSQEAR